MSAPRRMLLVALALLACAWILVPIYLLTLSAFGAGR